MGQTGKIWVAVVLKDDTKCVGVKDEHDFVFLVTETGATRCLHETNVKSLEELSIDWKDDS